MQEAELPASSASSVTSPHAPPDLSARQSMKAWRFEQPNFILDVQHGVRLLHIALCALGMSLVAHVSKLYLYSSLMQEHISSIPCWYLHMFIWLCQLINNIAIDQGYDQVCWLDTACTVHQYHCWG